MQRVLDVLFCLFDGTWRHFQQYFSYIVAVSFIGGGNRRTTDLSQVSDKLYHIMLHTSPWSRFVLITLVVIGTNCIGSCKSNNHTIKTTTATASPSSIKIQNITDIRAFPKDLNYLAFQSFDWAYLMKV